MILFHHTGLNGRNGECGVDIRRYHGGHAVVVVTELDDNCGPSITNSWPALADQICHEFDLLAGKTIFIEKYPSHNGPMSTRDETYDLVEMEVDEGKHRLCDWKRISKEEVGI